jgi:beta-galactosidase
VPTPAAGWTTDDPVTVSTSLDGTGRRLHVVHNWGWAAATATAPAPLHDLLDGDRIAEGERLALGPWDVRVLRAENDD